MNTSVTQTCATIMQEDCQPVARARMVPLVGRCSLIRNRSVFLTSPTSNFCRRNREMRSYLSLTLDTVLKK